MIPHNSHDTVSIFLIVKCKNTYPHFLECLSTSAYSCAIHFSNMRLLIHLCNGNIQEELVGVLAEIAHNEVQYCVTDRVPRSSDITKALSTFGAFSKHKNAEPPTVVFLNPRNVANDYSGKNVHTFDSLNYFLMFCNAEWGVFKGFHEFDTPAANVFTYIKTLDTREQRHHAFMQCLNQTEIFMQYAAIGSGMYMKEKRMGLLAASRAVLVASSTEGLSLTPVTNVAVVSLGCLVGVNATIANVQELHPQATVIFVHTLRTDEVNNTFTPRWSVRWTSAGSTNDSIINNVMDTLLGCKGNYGLSQGSMAHCGDNQKEYTQASGNGTMSLMCLLGAV